MHTDGRLWLAASGGNLRTPLRGQVIAHVLALLAEGGRWRSVLPDSPENVFDPRGRDMGGK